MLLAEDFAFVHIPKCGGTTFRAMVKASGVRAAEVGNMDPVTHDGRLGYGATVTHRFHLVPPGVSEARVVMFVRPVDDWLASYYCYRGRTGWRSNMAVERLSGDVAGQRAYVQHMFRAYQRWFMQAVVFPLSEGGLRDAAEYCGLGDVAIPHLNSR